jgi:hypothetical protein
MVLTGEPSGTSVRGWGRRTGQPGRRTSGWGVKNRAGNRKGEDLTVPLPRKSAGQPVDGGGKSGSPARAQALTGDDIGRKEG